ncbi:cadherin-related family member 3-like [Chanos chanos]|uniref:Cadherin-related family member 3-like n=1 Tax=Chanos chanos TaxID=29144 RepID=A0A6J2V6S9_CHACN|nr:cadherin-related family member 3 [Chanos chanos]
MDSVNILIEATSSGVSLFGLPATVSLKENSPAGTEVIHFQVLLASGASVAAGFPQILNSDPITEAFLVSMQNSTHAKVTVTGAYILDFEVTPNRFVFQILVVDSNEDFDLQTLTVLLTDVDEPPVFMDEISFLYIVEKTPPDKIFEPIVFDPENKPLTFSLDPPDPAFTIDPGKGSLFTTKEFNYQTDARSYAFNLSVSDGNNTSFRPLFIKLADLSDDKPHFLNTITSYSIPEELSPGYPVANITAVLPESSMSAREILYSINDNNYLTINLYTGMVTIANRMDRDTSPLREAPTITVTVTAALSPPGPPLYSTINLMVTVTDINDNPPVCAADSQRRDIPETEALGAFIAMVTCTDNDVEPVFTQFTFTGLSCLECRQLFVLMSNKIILNGSLDFEDPNNLYTGNEYSLVVAAVDTNETSLKGQAYVYVTVIPVNEFPPVFSPQSYFFSISELLGGGAVIGSVNATDKDRPTTPLHYSLVSGGVVDIGNIFYVDPKMGIITLLTHPDYEDTQTHKLIIQAIDGDVIMPRSATATVIINITKANDEPPLCGPNKTSLVVPINLRVGSNVQGFTLSCQDRDSPPTSFIYTISGASNVNNHFSFSPSAGTNITRLILKEPFDYSSGWDRIWSYSLVVLISDANILSRRYEPRTGTVLINIQVVDPDLTTVITSTTPAITYINIKKNTFDASDWYVWFLTTLGILLLLGLLGYLLYRSCKYLCNKEYSCCVSRPMTDEEDLIPDKGPPKREVFMEVTKMNTLFDGEEVDPVTSRVYEYNSKSGARRWKDAIIMSKLPQTQPESSTMVITREHATESQTSNAQLNVSYKEGAAEDQSSCVGWAVEGKEQTPSSAAQSGSSTISGQQSVKLSLSQQGGKVDRGPEVTEISEV